MKGIGSYVVAVMAVVLLIACPKKQDPFFVAETTMVGVRTAITLTDLAFAKAHQMRDQSCDAIICAKLDPDKGEKYKACMAEDHASNAEYVSCMKKVTDAQVLWGKIEKTILATLSAGDELIAILKKIEAAKAGGNVADLEAACTKYDPTKGEKYKQCLTGETAGLTDWLNLFKGGMCVASKGLAFMPTEYDPYVKPVRAVLDSYCK